MGGQWIEGLLFVDILPTLTILHIYVFTLPRLFQQQLYGVSRAERQLEIQEQRCQAGL